MKDLMPVITSKDGRFHDGNPATGELGTRVTAQYLNNVQDHIRDVEAELKYVLSKAGLNPNDAKTTQVYDAIIAIINANRRSASTTSKGEVQLTDSINMASSVFGASAFAVKTAYDKGVEGVNLANNANDNANTRAASKNIVTNLDTLSDSCFFGCTDTAVGVPFDIAGSNQDLNGIHANAGYQKFQFLSIGPKDIRYRFSDDYGSTGWSAWQAIGFDDDVNNRVKKTGDTMTGNLRIVAGDYSSITLKNTFGNSLILEATPDNSASFGTLIYRKENNENISVLKLSKKTGTLAIVEDVVSKSGDTMYGGIEFTAGTGGWTVDGWDWRKIIDVSRVGDCAIGNEKGFIGFNSNGAIHFGGNAANNQFLASLENNGVFTVKEDVESQGKKLSESLPVPWLVGMPIPYPKSSIPDGFIALAGQAISASVYPKLYALYGSRLPDLRGEFIRGWDNGRGVDSGRGLLSSQNDAFQNHYHGLPTSNGNNDVLDSGITHVIKDNGGDAAPGAFYDVYKSSAPKGNNAGIVGNNMTRTYSIFSDIFRSAYSDQNLTVPKTDLAETRPRNIAFQYICLAG